MIRPLEIRPDIFVRLVEVRKHGFGEVSICGIAQSDRLLAQLIVLEGGNAVLNDGICEEMLELAS